MPIWIAFTLVELGRLTLMGTGRGWRIMNRLELKERCSVAPESKIQWVELIDTRQEIAVGYGLLPAQLAWTSEAEDSGGLFLTWWSSWTSWENWSWVIWFTAKVVFIVPWLLSSPSVGVKLTLLLSFPCTLLALVNLKSAGNPNHRMSWFLAISSNQTRFLSSEIILSCRMMISSQEWCRISWKMWVHRHISLLFILHY